MPEQTWAGLSEREARLLALVETAANEGRNVLPDADDDQAHAIEVFALLMIDVLTGDMDRLQERLEVRRG